MINDTGKLRWYTYLHWKESNNYITRGLCTLHNNLDRRSLHVLWEICPKKKDITLLRVRHISKLEYYNLWKIGASFFVISNLTFETKACPTLSVSHFVQLLWLGLDWKLTKLIIPHFYSNKKSFVVVHCRGLTFFSALI